MSAISLPRPGIHHGPYPDGGPQRDTRARWRTMRPRVNRGLSGFASHAQHIRTMQQALADISDRALADRAQRLAEQLRLTGTTEALCQYAFALTATAAQRQLGINLYDEQLYAGWTLLRGALIEMDTGEGKTVTAALAACTAALAGTPVHIITANDYLVARDAADMASLYNALGLQVGAAEAALPEEQRRNAYACDITYVNNKQVVFDYLLDRQRAGVGAGSIRRRINTLLNAGSGPAPLLRGLYFAIIDEADSVLIDEVRTPLVMSRRADNAPAPSVYPVALGLASRLDEDQDFYKSAAQRRVLLTDTGERHLAELCTALAGVWSKPRYRQELVQQALHAVHLMQPRRDYVVRDGAIVLIDENTGRAVPERTLRNGLQQMLESKERCRITDPAETVSQLTYRRFFARYLKLSGMSGTIAESAAELRRTYNLRTVRIPPHRPSRRVTLPTRVLADTPAKRAALLREVSTVHATHRPVLIGVRSVAEAQWVSEALTEFDLPHRLLNADHESDEAAVVAAAGALGAITVATNMAGRGTDIKLGNGVAGLGGLHVIVAAQNDARRINRQLIGRSGRQGDPGSSRILLSFEDEVLQRRLGGPLCALLGVTAAANNPLSGLLGRWAVRFAQARTERMHAHERWQLLRQDERLEDLLAFTGPQE